MQSKTSTKKLFSAMNVHKLNTMIIKKKYKSLFILICDVCS